MSWKWTHTMWTLLAAGAEPAWEAMQGQPMNKQTLMHAGWVWIMAMWLMWKTSPKDGDKPTTPPAQ